MNRRKELLEVIDNDITFVPLVDQIIMMEKKLDEIANLPFYKVNPTNPMQQKALPVFRMYKELLQQYTNCIKTIERKTSGDDEKISLLRKWWKDNEKKSVDTRQ